MNAENLPPLKTYDFRHAPLSINSELTFTREGEASFYGSDGCLHFAQPGTNWLIDSLKMANLPWSIIGSVISAIDDKDIAGDFIFVKKLVEGKGASEHRISQEVTVKMDIPLTISVYLKAGTRNMVQFSFLNAASYTGGNPGMRVNLNDGKITSKSSNIISCEAINSGNGWWRLVVTGVPDLGTDSGMHLYILNENNALSYEGNTDKYIYLWGAQFEQGFKPSAFTPTTTAPYFGLRYNYNLGLAPALAGILVEPAGTNLFLYSQTFESATWKTKDADIDLVPERSPDGTLNAYKLIEKAGYTSHYFVPDPMVATELGGIYTISIFLKASGRNWAYIIINGVSAHFDLANGILGNLSTKIESAAMENAGNGWYRCTATFISNTPIPAIRIGAENVNAETVYNGNGKNGILIWGAQFEKGSHMTSYIRTKNVPASRSAEKVVLSGPASNVPLEVFVQRSNGGTWLTGQTEDHEITVSSSEVQLIQFYTPVLSNIQKETISQNLFPQEYSYYGDDTARVLIFGTEYNAQTPNKPWSLQKAFNKTSPTFRLQVKAGDRWIGDNKGTKSRERSELYLKNADLPYNQDTWLSFSIKIDPGEALNLSAVDFCYIGQFHASEDAQDISSAPVLGLRLEGLDTIRIYTCSTTDNPHTVSPPAVPRASSNFTRGIWHRIVVRARFSPTNGELQWWKNGQEILNITGIGMGFPDNVGPYWKFGIYRSAMPQTVAVEYANMELSYTTSLISRVTEPLIII